MKLKICGITKKEEIAKVNTLPVDFIGINFIERSKRKVDIKKAKDLIKALSKKIIPVAILEDHGLSEVEEIVKETKIKTLQLHGNETTAYCKKLKAKKLKIIKVFPAKPETIKKLKSYKSVCDYILIDAHDKKNKMGGTGKTADWKVANKIVIEARKLKLPIFLAGGLSPENAGAAIAEVNPDGLDLNSGVENKSGLKCKRRITKLLKGLGVASK